MSVLAVPATGRDARRVPPRVSSPEFVGRATELAGLEAAFSRAEGGGRAPPSSAASRAWARRGCCASSSAAPPMRGPRVLRGECKALGAGEQPYAPIASALRASRVSSAARLRDAGRAGAGELARLVPEWGSTAAPSDRAAHSDASAQAWLFRTLRGLLDRLAADGAPCSRSRTCIGPTARRSSCSPCCCGACATSACCSSAPTAATSCTAATRCGRSWPRRSAARGAALRAEPFRPTELAAQVAGILGDTPVRATAGRLHARSDGNPFFAEELLAACGAPPARWLSTLRDVPWTCGWRP